MRAAEVMAAVAAHYPAPRYLTFQEVRTTAGLEAGRRLDAWILDTWPSGRFERVTVEVKVSRADYRAEVKDPAKRAHGMLLSNRFVFATPAGLVPTGELPYDCGLLEVTPDGQARMTVEAPWRDTGPPSWSFLASLLPRAADPAETRRRGLATEIRRDEDTLRRLRRELDRLTEQRETAERRRRMA